MNPTVALLKKCKDQFPSAHLTMSCILSGIRNPSDKIKAIVAQLRAEPDKAKRTILKKDLPAIVWGADITTRDPTVANRELSRSGLICLDLDAVPDLAAARGKLQEDPHVAATWLSPSGDGLKCLVVITGTLATIPASGLPPTWI